jgi:hypothetical protein
LLLVLITRASGALVVFVRSAEQEVGQVISGPDPARPIEVKGSVGLIVINGILLQNRKPATKLPGVAAPIPGQRVRKSIGIVSLPVHVRVEANVEAAIKVKVRRAERIVRLYIDAQSRQCRWVRCRNGRLVPTLPGCVKLIQQGRRKRLGIGDIRKIVPSRGVSDEARDVCPKKRV